jgi:hypothetical protein
MEVKMLKIGAVILTIVGVFNLLLATGILVAIIFFGKNPPILYVSLGKADISALNEQVLRTFKSLAIYFNSAVVASCVGGIFVIWMGLVRGQGWAFWALLITAIISQVSGFVADSFIGNKTLGVNIAFTVLYLLGMGLSCYGLWMR